jgi:hypothetical protein
MLRDGAVCAGSSGFLPPDLELDFVGGSVVLFPVGGLRWGRSMLFFYAPLGAPSQTKNGTLGAG